MRSHGWYDLPPFAYDRPSRRLTVGLEKSGRFFTVSFEPRARGLAISGDGLPSRELAALARRMFCLDWKLAGFYETAAAYPPLAWIDRGAGRFLRAPSAWEDAAKVLLTTNCSWAATRGMVERLVDRFGSGKAFPSAETLAAATEARLRADIRCGYRAPHLLAFARRVAAGTAKLAEWEDPSRPSEEVRALILREPGLGPYAAEALLRLFGRHEFFAFDSWTRARYAELHRVRSGARLETSVARRYRRFGSFQGLAFWLELTRQWHDGAEPLWP